IYVDHGALSNLMIYRAAGQSLHAIKAAFHAGALTKKKLSFDSADLTARALAAYQKRGLEGAEEVFRKEHGDSETLSLLLLELEPKVSEISRGDQQNAARIEILN